MWDWLKQRSVTTEKSIGTVLEQRCGEESMMPTGGKTKCASCEILKEQLHEARLREQRMARQLESKDSTIDRVIASKFDRAQVTPTPLPKQEKPFEAEHLTDVLTGSEQAFSELP